MKKGSKKGSRKRNRTSKSSDQKDRQGNPVSLADFARIEFYRHAMAVLPEPKERHPGVVFFVESDDHISAQRFCTCPVSKKRTCPHLLKSSEVIRAVRKKGGLKAMEENFKASLWYRMAAVFGEDTGQPSASSIILKQVASKGTNLLKVFDKGGGEILTYLSSGPDLGRFLDRFHTDHGETSDRGRGHVLNTLGLLTLSDNERLMNGRGFKTRRQAFEEGFWYRAAYHGFREFGSDGLTVRPAIEEASGLFGLTFNDAKGEPLLRMVVPRSRVKALLSRSAELLPNQHDLAIHPIPLQSIFRISANTEMDLEVRPLVKLIQENGEEAFFAKEDLERFQYGDLVYIKELGILAETEKPDSKRKFVSPKKMVLKRSQVPHFLDEFGEEIHQGKHLVDPGMEGLRIYRSPDRVEISPEAIHRDWCWLSVTYGFGDSVVSLADIVRARVAGERFLGIKEGWIDCQTSNMSVLDGAVASSDDQGSSDEEGRVRLSRMDLFRLMATSEKPFNVVGDGDRAVLLKKILALRPLDPMPALTGMATPLWAYQKVGVDWIRFLFENGFGGLLCDEMGLGKTHQTMAFMLYLREVVGTRGPFLVICPTTVLSHWSNRIRAHAPGLRAVIYQGGQRDLQCALTGNDVLLTSYGLVRRDIEELKSVPFSLVVFDEIQNIKNPETLGYRAAREIRAEMKLGLTGTPIENTLHELKALVDMVVPGYMGTDAEFERRYVMPIEGNRESPIRKELTRLISPFCLRRLKKSVLDDLPDKMEDIRTCLLSEEQVKLYRDAVSQRGRALVEVLRREEDEVPYMHIFAILSLLKQICDHPALVEGNPEAFEKHESGKWELFKEILSESLDSGQKVVVYSQYLGMISIMEHYLREQQVGFVTLTGRSRDRGKIIERFQEDPLCRVYVGSLKAGGTGIDLVAASVVIHYDRWWNAAREDQATDRVHRIGQKRGVHVFKLVTEGT
ncbi:MAG: DEAD/DEAH box helicase, partial [Pseudomonadota bacterium]